MPRSRYNIDVTAKDIAKASAGDSFKCVVAQAIARQVPNARKIDVDIQTIRWSDEDGRHVFLTPYTAAGYVVAFDAGEELHPFRFQLKDSIPSKQKRALSGPAKAAKASRNKIKLAREELARAETVLTDPDSSPDKVAQAQVRVKAAPAKIAAAQAAHDDLKMAYKVSGQSTAEQRTSETARPAPPKVFKTKRREYGHRVLRVNQVEGRTHYAG